MIYRKITNTWGVVPWNHKPKLLELFAARLLVSPGRAWTRRYLARSSTSKVPETLGQDETARCKNLSMGENAVIQTWPLVNVNKILWKITMCSGKTHDTWQCSIVMWVITRGYGCFWGNPQVTIVVWIRLNPQIQINLWITHSKYL